MSVIRVFSIPVVVAVTVFGFSNMLVAADQPGTPSKAPTMVEDFHGCVTCDSACDSCGKVHQTHCQKS